MIRCLMVLLVAFSALSTTAAEPAKTELDGKWELISFNHMGREEPGTVNKKCVLVQENGIQVVTIGGKLTAKNRFTIHPNSTSKAFDFLDLGKDDAPKMLAIYKVTGDKMTIASFKDGRKNFFERPTDFAPATDKTIVMFRRAK